MTSRSVDVGALVTVGAPGATPLFTVSDDSKAAHLCERAAELFGAMIVPGMTATFTVPEYPGETFTATLAANAEAVDRHDRHGAGPAPGRQRRQGRLKPGDYAQVRFDLPATANAIRLPASALIFNDDGTAVAVVGPGNRVSVKPVTILRDYGTSVEIASGVTRQDRVIDNPPDALKAGDEVRVAKS